MEYYAAVQSRKNTRARQRITHMKLTGIMFAKRKKSDSTD